MIYSGIFMTGSKNNLRSSLSTKKILISLCLGLCMTLGIWIFRNYFLSETPLFLFNLAGLLQLPGAIIVLVVVAIVSSKNGWAAIHGVPPYNFFIYFANFLFYSFLSYVIQSLFLKSKFKKGKIEVNKQKGRADS